MVKIGLSTFKKLNLKKLVKIMKKTCEISETTKPKISNVISIPKPVTNVRPKVDYYNDYYAKQGFLQPDHMTKMDRFPIIFESAKKLIPNPKRILSFGCSTGEEAQSLRKYFPDAEIVGVDIDYTSVQKARKSNTDSNIHFHTDLGATGSYDLVFCLMVFFCMDTPIPYESFSTVLTNLDKRVNKDGFLMIYTADHNPSWVKSIRENYEPTNVWIRNHNKVDKDYYNGYFKKK